jgi:hypothetical protein
MGFSAGGGVARGVAFQYKPESRPAFLALIYPGGLEVGDANVPADARPMFITEHGRPSLDRSGGREWSRICGDIVGRRSPDPLDKAACLEVVANKEYATCLIRPIIRR